ncbi:MAG: CPBP family intramembrane metalloprotease [Deltaproteobacteria bacterium]|nr:CPBP family intramembrane metalloprotease [Deltaproteobacteria bacterium]
MPRSTPSQQSPLLFAAFAYAVVCIVALLVLPHLGGPLRAYRAGSAGAVLLGPEPLLGVLWGLGGGVLLAGLSQAIAHWTAWGRRLARLLARLVQPLHAGDALLLAFLSGFGEELVFRGIALPYLGLAASALLFGLAHIIPRHGLWPWALWAAVAGTGLGWLGLVTGGLLGPILAHVTVNAFGLILLSRERTA